MFKQHWQFKLSILALFRQVFLMPLINSLSMECSNHNIELFGLTSHPPSILFLGFQQSKAQEMPSLSLPILIWSITSWRLATWQAWLLQSWIILQLGFCLRMFVLLATTLSQFQDALMFAPITPMPKTWMGVRLVGSVIQTLGNH